MRVERDWLRALVFGTDESRRYTQDSPVLPDVWLVAGLFYCADPAARVDLLLTPYRNKPPTEVAKEIQRRLTSDVEVPSARRTSEIEPQDKTLWSGGLTERRVVLRSQPTLSVTQTNVAVALTLEELVVVVLPLTTWWRRYIDQAPANLESLDAKAQADDRHLRSDETRSQRSREWMARVIGVLMLCSREPSLDPDLARASFAPAWMSMDEARRLRRATRQDAERFEVILKDSDAHEREFWRLVQLAQHRARFGQDNTLVWSVSLNREAAVSIGRSVPATKADAARQVFNIDCSKICWAVLDSGIDASHQAFVGDDGQSRVTSTYDFRDFRSLVSVDGTSSMTTTGLHTAEVDTELVERQTKRLRESLKSGRAIDWGSVAEIIRVPPEHYRAPQNDHGTHVAGIIGARKVPGRPDAGEGMCPDIRLCDLRVLNDEGRGDEFSIIAALQFVRYLNASSDRMVIHGVNLSLSLLHDVENYACGRTPICDECERLVNSGVVVVVAAGNRGYERVLTPFGELDAYRAISITDPGNAELVITVGSTHRFEPHTYGVSYFSSRGPTGDGRSKPDILAPGERIDSTIPGEAYGAKDGTSMAAPHVSGAAALLMARHSEFQGQPKRIKQILCQTATDLGREKYFQGCGMVDVLRAMQSS